jgi:hypothetical protein
MPVSPVLPDLPELPELPTTAGGSFDPLAVVASLASAAAAAAIVLLVLAWPWRTSRSPRVAVGCLLAVVVGFCVGAWRLGLKVHWPPREGQDRLLFLLFPALLAVELIAACLGRYRPLAWLPRLLIASAAAPVLLHGSIYLEDLTGPGSREWTVSQTVLILGGLAVALAGTWTALALLARRGHGRSVPLALTLTCTGAAATVMLSGSASGGELGLNLAASLAGVVAASLLLKEAPDPDGLLGVGVIGLFSLLVAGRFFSELATSHALLLFFAPLLCWLAELFSFRGVRPSFRGVVGVVLTLTPVVIVVLLAQQKYAADTARSSSGSKLVQ